MDIFSLEPRKIKRKRTHPITVEVSRRKRRVAAKDDRYYIGVSRSNYGPRSVYWRKSRRRRRRGRRGRGERGSSESWDEQRGWVRSKVKGSCGRRRVVAVKVRNASRSRCSHFLTTYPRRICLIWCIFLVALTLTHLYHILRGMMFVQIEINDYLPIDRDSRLVNEISNDISIIACNAFCTFSLYSYI